MCPRCTAGTVGDLISELRLTNEFDPQLLEDKSADKLNAPVSSLLARFADLYADTTPTSEIG